MNSPFVLEQVDRFAARVRRQAGNDVARQITLAWVMALGRQPMDDELETARVFLEEQTTLLKNAQSGGNSSRGTALANLCQALVGSNGFLYVE